MLRCIGPFVALCSCADHPNLRGQARYGQLIPDRLAKLTAGYDGLTVMFPGAISAPSVENDGEPGPSRSTPAPGHTTGFGQRHMSLVTVAVGTVAARTAPAVPWRQINLRQGMKMTTQLELRSRAALCKQLAKREPENRVFWMAEAESWSRLSKENFAARRSKHQVADSDGVTARNNRQKFAADLMHAVPRCRIDLDQQSNDAEANAAAAGRSSPL
jgi:hypothetical protein